MTKKSILMSLVCCLFANLLEAQESKAPKTFSYELQENRIVLITPDEPVKKEFPLPANGLALKEFNSKLHVALGETGVMVFAIGPDGDLTDPRLVPVSHGEVVGFLEMDRELWMRIDSTTAVKIDGGEASGPVSVVPLVAPPPKGVSPAFGAPPKITSASPAKEPEHVEISTLYAGKVKLNAGSDEGLRAGDLLVVYRQDQVSQIGEETFRGEVEVAALEVEAVNKDSAIALIWPGDRVSKSDVAFPYPETSRPSKAYPRHLTHLGEAEAAFRPIINVGSDEGFGALCDLTLSWWGRHYFVNLRMQPLGFGWVNDGKVVTNSLVAEAGYSSRAFAVGMGLGMASVSGDMDQMLGFSMAGAVDTGKGTELPPWKQRTRHGFALSQFVRLGAKDGFNITVGNLLIYHKSNPDYDGDESRQGFIYGGTNGRVTVPLALRFRWFTEGGGGVMGYGYGATGVFTWVRGNGDAGSIGVSASAGFAGLWGVRRRESADPSFGDYTETMRIIGPMFSLGATYRFGRMPK